MSGTVADTMCPECATGKHHNCDERSLDQATDTVAICPCAARDHAEEPEPAEPEHAAIVDAEVVEKPASRKERARLLLLQAAVLKRLVALNERARAVAAAEYEAKDREGATHLGLPLGNVRMDEGRVTVRVTDAEAALAWTEVNFPEQVNAVTIPTVTDEGLAWLREHHPEWITDVTAYREVYPAFLKSLTDGVKRAKGGWVKRGSPPEPLPWVEPATGEERTDVPPWIDYRVSDPVLVVTASDEALGVADRLISGALPELGSGS